MWPALLLALTGIGFAGGALAASAEDLGKGGLVESCILAAAEAHALPPALLVILLQVEGGRLGEVNPNKNGTVDIGPMQVNEIWLPKLAARWHASGSETYLALRDKFCANVEGGAWVLRQALDEAGGDLWEGVARYHSHKERLKTDYLHKVLRQAWTLVKEAAADPDAAQLGGAQ